MVQRVELDSMAGAKIGISAALPATYDQAGYDSSSLVFTPIAKLESYGNHGMVAAVGEFTDVETSTTNKTKGSKNYGNKALVLGYLPSDAGQALLKTASEAGNTHYSIEVRYADNEYHYFDVIVSKFEYVDGAVNDVRKINVELAICRKPVIIAQA